MSNFLAGYFLGLWTAGIVASAAFWILRSGRVDS